MDKEKAQQILNLVEKSINQVKKSAYQEQFMLNTKEIDMLYLQILNLLYEKQKRTQNLIENNLSHK